MGKPRRKPVPHLPAGGKITIIISSQPTPKPEPLRRTYEDSQGRVVVTRIASIDDYETLLDDYTYEMKPIKDVYDFYTNAPATDDRSIELRIAALACSRMGIARLAMSPRNSPDPDLLLKAMKPARCLSK